MSREDLDAWFAAADDVLADWHPGSDAMVARVPADDSDRLPPRGDSYYEQRAWRPSVGASTTITEWTQLVRRRLATEQEMRADLIAGMQAFGEAASTIGERMVNSMRLFTEATTRGGDRTAEMQAQLRALRKALAPRVEARSTEAVRARALDARRNRNTGPRGSGRLDGLRR
jgi:hypothetical protein